jgi:hypothetical protein
MKQYKTKDDFMFNYLGQSLYPTKQDPSFISIELCVDVVAQTTFIDPNQNMNVVLHPKSIVEGIGEVAVKEEHVQHLNLTLCKVFNYGEWCWKFVYDFWVKINTLIW